LGLKKGWAMPESDETIKWRKSSFSGCLECLEVAQSEQYVLLRDSKDPLGVQIRLTPSEWAAFLSGVRAGEFD
jgi:hypothetical protein